MKKHLTTIILIVILMVGLSLLLYPSFSNFWNTRVSSRAVAAYNAAVADLDEDDYDEIFAAAQSYNATLFASGNVRELTESQLQEYNNLLDVTGTGIMGYIEIPTIGVELPIYHGTDEGVLEIAAGHINWSSLPVGGVSTHSVLSGHRGLPSAKLFTDLDELVEGDTFELHILDQVLTYQVDQILIVLPEDTDALSITEGKDYCTLVTCTPYGINTHRLLVRGHRIETTEENQVSVTSDAIQVEPLVVASVSAAPVLLLLLLVAFIAPAKKEKTGEENEK